MSEQLSALVDNELDDDDSARLINSMKSDADLRARWDIYHQIGDALRRAPHFSSDFMLRMHDQLAQEPTVLAPHPQPQQPAARPHYALPIAASVAAFGLVGVLSWQMLSSQQEGHSPLNVASRLASSTQSALDDKAQKLARVQFTQAIPSTYLLAHQEFSPSYTVEGMPAYIRTVSEQR